MVLVTTQTNAVTDRQIVKAVSAVDWDFTDADTSFFTHNFHPYPAKFIPQIPATLIELFTHEGDTVLDPFCGSGTTLVEAVRHGRNAIGMDANPLAALIAQVKCCPLSDDERRAVNATIREAERLVTTFYSSVTTNVEPLQLSLFQFTTRSVQPKIPEIPDLDFWFPPEAINELALLKQVIDDCELERAREFLQVAFSSIIVNVSYQDSDTRYTRRDKKLQAGDTLKKWLAKIADMLDRVREFDAIALPGSVRTLTMDSRQLSGVEPESVALAVTSVVTP